MNFTPRQDGTDRATVQIAFHIGLHELVVAAMLVLDGTDTQVDELSKAAIERELRNELWSTGDNFAEFGAELVIDHRIHAQRETIVRKVATLYGLDA